jgi:hypothetical protein
MDGLREAPSIPKIENKKINVKDYKESPLIPEKRENKERP